MMTAKTISPMRCIAETFLFFGADPRGCGPLFINEWSTIGPRGVRSSIYYYKPRKRRWQFEEQRFTRRGKPPVTAGVFLFGRVVTKESAHAAH